jgi:hypothetical protein
MFIQNNLENILKECGVSAYENSIMIGLDSFILSCSQSIQKRGSELTIHDRHYLLYLMKFLCQNWSNPEREPRLRTKLCLKILFIILLSDKCKSECKQLLKESVSQVAEHWEISPEEYPFLTKNEEGKIKSWIEIISQQTEIHEKFISLEIEETFLKSEFCLYSESTISELIDLYRKACSFSETANSDIRLLKAFFVAVQELNISNEYPAIMKTLPIHFCITEIRKLLPLSPAYNMTDQMGGFSSEQGSDFFYSKRLFIKYFLDRTVYFKNLPVWAEWLFLAGQKVAMDSSRLSKLVIGFSLPTRAYAVLFFLLGYETWKAKKMMKDFKDNKSYFNFLSKCEQNEALLIWDNKRWKRCWFKGIETLGSEKFIKVNVPGAEAKQHTSYVPETKITKLRKAVDPKRAIAANQIGFGMKGIDSLIIYFNKKENDILRFLIEEQSSYTVVGNISLLKREIDEEKIYCCYSGKYSEISFQDILRFKNFMTDFELPRGIILSSRENCDSGFTPLHTVIYDGSSAYLNRQGSIHDNIEAVFLDRTEPQFSNARDQLMTRYCDREDNLNLFDKIPASAEVIVFKESI